MSALKELPRFEGRPADEEVLKRFRERIHRLETTEAPRFEGEEPLDAIALYKELLEDYENAYNKYYEKRIILSGLVTKVQDDEFGAPSFQFTDNSGSRCYALVVFPDETIYQQVKEGDQAEIIGNVVFIREPYGLVVKNSRLISTESGKNE